MKRSVGSEGTSLHAALVARFVRQKRVSRAVTDMQHCDGSMQTCDVNYAAVAVASPSFTGRKPE
jgi:hypothetical protein